jgi:hypothetical protein
LKEQLQKQLAELEATLVSSDWNDLTLSQLSSLTNAYNEELKRIANSSN